MVKKGDELQDVQELQVIAQLIDSMDVIVGKLEKAYSNKNGEEFKTAKEEILKSQKKIDNMLNNKEVIEG
jgi:hypothetical protein